MDDLSDIIIEGMQAPWERAPHSRYMLAVEYQANPFKDPVARLQDPYVGSMVRVLESLASNDPGRCWDLHNNQEAYGAWRIFHNSSKFNGYRWLIEAMIMGRASDDQINQEIRSPIGPALYHWYRKLFFDVDESLDYPFEIAGKVFQLCMARNRIDTIQDSFYKVAAYQLGFQDWKSVVGRWVPSPDSDGTIPPMLKKRMADWNSDKLMTEASHILGDAHNLLTERTMAVVQLAQQSGKISDGTASELEEEALSKSAQEVIRRFDVQMLTSKDKVENNGIIGTSSYHHMKGDPRLLEFQKTKHGTKVLNAENVANG